MRRDVLPTKTQGTNVSAYQIGNSSSDQISSPISTVQIIRDYQQADQIYSNKTKLIGNQFYSSYDPEVGINTASFLGGILVLLVIYVIYRTKCRKRILKFCQNCTMKYFPEEFPGLNANPKQSVDKFNSNESQWISENAKMIWKERTNLSLHRDTSSALLQSTETDCREFEKGEYSLCLNTPDMQFKDNKNECENNRPQLPDYEENIEQATAHWVQNVKCMDIKERQLNGIILKIPPELVSHNAKIRSHFHSVTDYGDHANESVNISKRNKSLPSLIEQHVRMKSNYASVSSDTAIRSSRIYVPLATEEDDSLDFPTNQMVVPYQTGSRVPIDICPIVKVQHYHSRSKRRLTSLNHSSTDEISSSSDEQRLITNMEPKTASDAKYKCLDDSDHEAYYMRLDDSDCDAPKYMRVDNTDSRHLDEKGIPVKYVNYNNQFVKSLETNL